MFEFPLIGFYAEWLLIIEGLIVLLSLEISLVFLNKVIKNKNKIRTLQEIAYVWLFLGLSFMWVFFIISDFYTESASSRMVFLVFGYLTLAICALMFIYIIEKYKIFIKKFLFSLIFFFYTIFFIVLSIVQINLSQLFSSLFWVIFIIFFIFYSRELNSIFKNNPLLGGYKKNLIKLVSGIILLIIGFSLTTDFSINSIGLGMRIIGDMLHLFALVFLYLFFSSIPSFSEYDWQEKIESIYIMHKSGLLIYKKSFLSEDNHSYDSATSGAITSIKMMLESISNKETTSFIEKKGKIITIQPGKYIYGTLISQEKLNSLQILLNNFISKIEQTYSDILKNWEGDLKVLRPIDKIARDIFF